MPKPFRRQNYLIFPANNPNRQVRPPCNRQACNKTSQADRQPAFALANLPWGNYVTDPIVSRKNPQQDPVALQLLSQLETIYQEADRLFTNWTCPASTECCRFGITGREPYLTTLEWKLVERAVARNGGPLSERNRSKPILASPKDADPKRLRVLTDEQRTCPLLNHKGQCSIYTSRPFGCRTFFCGQASSDTGYPRSEVAKLARQISDLSARFTTDGEKVRPFTRLLG